MATKTCKKCGKEFDSKLVVCPDCKSSQDLPSEIELTSDQINQLSIEVGKKLASKLFLFFGLISLLFGIGFYQAYKHATKKMEDMLVERISDEFKQPRIHTTIKEVAEGKAKELMLDEIKPEVTKLKNEIQASIKDVKISVKETISQLNDLVELTNADASARYGSRKSYNRLKEFSLRHDSLGSMAMRNVSIIERDLLIFRTVPKMGRGLTYTKDGETTSVDKLSTSHLFVLLESRLISSEERSYLMRYIKSRPKKEILTHAKSILEGSDSLPACAAICGILKEILGDRADFLEFEQWSKVCAQELANEKK